MQNLSMFREKWKKTFTSAPWQEADWYAALFPLRSRLSCRTAMELAATALAPKEPPAEGWAAFTLHWAVGQVFENRRLSAGEEQAEFARQMMTALSLLLQAEGENCPFDPRYDFAFCTAQEQQGYPDYAVFLAAWEEEHLYALMRLSDELTPFCTLSHIAGVHHVAMTVARELLAGGEAVDLPMVSAAAAGHDVGKFGCMPGERVPYLHYYYTDQWFDRIGLPAVGQIAANHSTWDLELENLTTESLLLIYADFRMKQERRADGTEEVVCYTLRQSFSVILNKLDNVDAAKRRRYEYVYHKLCHFEDYLVAQGVDITLCGARREREPAGDIALMLPEAYCRTLRLMAVEHNMHIMHQFGREKLFSNLLEEARSEKDWSRVRTYLCVLEEYCTYLSAGQKMQTLRFLYELLLHREGDIRRQAAALLGRIIARFNMRYKKELPTSAGPEAIDQTQLALWAQYLNLLFYPDQKLTPQQKSHIRFTAKLVIGAVLANCEPGAIPHFLSVLLPYYEETAALEPGAALALTDTLCYLPLEEVTASQVEMLFSFACHQMAAEDTSLQTAALRFLRCLTERKNVPPAMREEAQRWDKFLLPALRYLAASVREKLGMPHAFSLSAGDVADIFVDDLKTATPWMLKLVNIELLTRSAELSNAMHIAAHFSNLIKVSEAVVVREAAGEALLRVCEKLTYDQQNEIAVELSKGLEAGRYEFSKYIPQCLGELMMKLRPAELDEVLDYLQQLSSHANPSVAASAVDTVGVALEHYGSYAGRYPEAQASWDNRRRIMAGMILKDMASYRENVRQEAMFVTGNLFSSQTVSLADKAWFFTLCAHKMLFLICENDQRGLNDLYCSAALHQIYQFIVRYEVDCGAFEFSTRQKVAFFPGTFDPFTLSHKGIVQTIRDMGFEVYLAVDEFSWSKKTQPSLIRRQIVSMSVADEFHVHLFPANLPVNLASPEDLHRLRQLFAGRELYLAVGSDVVGGASSYRLPPVEDSVHSLNHIVFRRESAIHGDGAAPVDLACITGKVIELQLPPQLEDISSTRIRENIDLNRDISHLIDPVVQEFIYQRGLYLREPQYKPLMEAGELTFEWTDGHIVLREHGAAQGSVLWHYVRTTELYDLVQDAKKTGRIRERAAGKLLCITDLAAGTEEALQLLLTELFAKAMSEDCAYALYLRRGAENAVAEAVLKCQGFSPLEGEDTSLMLVDMSAPVVFLQNVETAIKAPLCSDRGVEETIRQSRLALKMALVQLYPGKLILTISAQLLYHRLVEKITRLNGVPLLPSHPRVLGPYMCVPFGKLLRGHAVPNTVTKTVHTDKIFAPDIQHQWINAFPGYTSLRDQMRTVRSFRRGVILVDDQLHTGRRIGVLDALSREEGVEIREVLVGILSGQGKDLMQRYGRAVDQIYFVPNLRAWYVESTLYPFIGGDTVEREGKMESGLQPSVNLILPYVYPEHLKRCGAPAAYRFSTVCLENTLEIMTALESAYRRTYARSLTLRRLSEAVVLPLCPDKGGLLYDPNQAVSAYLKGDLAALKRLENLFI
jgi:nicotinic acid mononucleotide adenylyltransferase